MSVAAAGPAAASAASAASASAAAPSAAALVHARRASAMAPPMDEIVESFVLRLKRRDLVGSNLVALHTAELLRTLLSRRKYSSVNEMIAIIRSAGKTLTLAHPIELAIGNIVRRVLYIIRHETAAIQKELAAGGADSSVQQAQVDLSLSLHKMLDRQAVDLTSLDLDSVHITSKLKPAVIEEIGILMDEMKGAEIQIAEQAIEHIYAKSVAPQHMGEQTPRAIWGAEECALCCSASLLLTALVPRCLCVSSAPARVRFASPERSF